MPLSPPTNPSLSSPFQRKGRDYLPLEHDQSADGQRPLYGNLQWTATEAGTKEAGSRGGPDDFRRSSKGSMSASSPPRFQEPAKIDFNGIKAVPTGPKPGVTAAGRLSTGPLPNVDPVVKAAPHILIPGSCVPPDPCVLRHLRGFLGPPQPEGIFVDDDGYYLTWPDSEKGHLELEKCVARKHGLILFSQYTVEMKAFHWGQPLHRQVGSTKSASHDKALSDASSLMRLSQETEPQAPFRKEPLPDLDPVVQAAPHIFVRGLPLRTDNVKHLMGFLGSPRPDEIFVDNFGYYLVWPDTLKGHEHLEKCIKRKNGSKIFSRFIVEMTAFHEGLSPIDPVDAAKPELPGQVLDVVPPNVLLLKGIEPHDPPRVAASMDAGKTNDNKKRQSPGVSVGSHVDPKALSALEADDEPPTKRPRNEESQDTAVVAAGGIGEAAAPHTAAGILEKGNGTLNGVAEPLSEATGKVSADDNHAEEADKLVEESFAALDAPRRNAPKTPAKLNLTRRKRVRSEATLGAVETDTVNGASPAHPTGGGGKRIRRDKKAFTSEDVLAIRPDCKYDDLICFALCEAPGQRLQARSIINWIANNIPGFYLDGDPWSARISMTLSASTGKGKNLYMRQETREDDADLNGKGSWWKLRPEVVDTLQRWDPVLKTPVSPPRNWHKDALEEETPDDEDGDELPIKPRRAGRRAVAARQKATDAASKRAKGVTVGQQTVSRDRGRTAGARSGGAVARPHALDLVEEPRDNACGEEGATEGVLTGNRQGSTPPGPNEEPLAGLHRRESAHLPPPAAMVNLPVTGCDAKSDVDMADVGPAPSEEFVGAMLEEATKTQFHYSPRNRGRQQPDAKVLRIDTYQTGNSSLAQIVKLEADNIEYTATSLFDEWPEYDPGNQLDKFAKMEEIKKRPTRKQMFAKPAMYSRLGSSIIATPSHSFTSNTADNGDSDGATPGPSSERNTRSPKKLSYQQVLPALEESVREFQNVEEFFEIPAYVLPVHRYNQLAFRDGTRDKNGRLPRAGVYYHPGYE
ncbi:hypothetical protein B0A55_03014 [Friedmanniomyces simplex]|uniref:Fork-head domain-containing protein n=1 Tax=Friedmanniomyces simplex TaxID=329884 RepID=A0A4U0XY03_9PEZI|nr:hypothetical protein B0A55_03014 [Friedmanniomyces simplex]